MLVGGEYFAATASLEAVTPPVIGKRRIGWLETGLMLLQLREIRRGIGGF